MVRVNTTSSQPISASLQSPLIAATINNLEEQPRAGVRSFESDGPGPLSQAGPRHDNDHRHINDIRILPTADESLSTTRLPWMPERNVDSHHIMPHGFQRHVDTQFRLLRFDATEKLRDVNYRAAQEAFLSDTTIKHQYAQEYLETPSGNRFFLYHDLKIEAVVSDVKEGITLQTSFECPQILRGREMFKANRFQRGMLCAVLCLNHENAKLSIHYFVVHHRSSTQALSRRTGNQNRAAVELALLPDASDDDIWCAMTLASGLRGNVTMALVEYPKLLYQGFAHTLKCLQNMSDGDYAFSDYISPSQDAYHVGSPTRIVVQPPCYSRAPDFAFDLQPLTRKPGSLFTLADLSSSKLQMNLRHLAENTTLDEGQTVALLYSLKREFAFIQGPPGCGKTFLGIALARVLLSCRPAHSKMPLLVVCRTNHALDSFMAGLRDAGVEKLMRIGSSSREDWTKCINLKELAREHRYSLRENRERHQADEEKDANFTILDAWCKGLSNEVSTGFPCWQHVKLIIQDQYPQIFAQLVISHSDPEMQAFIYDYWANGGDLTAIKSLHGQLLDRLRIGTLNEDERVDRKNPEQLQRVVEDLPNLIRSAKAAAEQDDIWDMSLLERKALLEEWHAKVDKMQTTSQLYQVHKDHRRHGQNIKDIVSARDVRVMRMQNVVGMTTTACAAKRDVLRKVGFEVLICEEAAELLEAHTLCSLLPSIKHSINIGDPLQLRPETEESAVARENPHGRSYRLNESLFERIMRPVDSNAKTVATSRLNIQRRMHPDIADITRITYPFLRDHPATSLHPFPKGLQHRVWWLDHSVSEDTALGVSKSATNLHEVGLVKGLVSYLLRGSDYSPRDIAVLTPYSGQLIELRSALSSTCRIWLSEQDKDLLVGTGTIDPEDDTLDAAAQVDLEMNSMLRLATIDNFQGEEANVIIASTVRSGEKLGFVNIPNRINVMLSRARHGLYIIGNSSALAASSRWAAIIQTFYEQGAIGRAITLRCDRHPTHSTQAASLQNFIDFAECPTPCGMELECGHTCIQPCHDQSLHALMNCQETCGKLLLCGHKCKSRCSEPCEPCDVLHAQFLNGCGHCVLVPCGSEAPSCDHFEGYLDLSCRRHSIGFTCGDAAKTVECDAVCGELLKCGHQCSAICGRCNIDGKHPACESVCGNSLFCGHRCLKLCHGDEDYPACELPCQPQCDHMPDGNKCNQERNPCMLPVLVLNYKGTIINTACCLTSGIAVAGLVSLVEATTVNTVFQPALQSLLDSANQLAEQVEYHAMLLERTSQPFLKQHIVPRTLAAQKNYDSIIARSEDILKCERQVSALRQSLVRFEAGLNAIESAFPGSVPNVSNLVKDRIDRIELQAITGRLKDTISTASYMAKAKDASQQMQKAASEVLMFARKELVEVLYRFDNDYSWTLEEIMDSCKIMLKEVDAIIEIL